MHPNGQYQEKCSIFMERGRLARTWVCGRLVRFEKRKKPGFHKAGETPAAPGADETSALQGCVSISHAAVVGSQNRARCRAGRGLGAGR